MKQSTEDIFSKYRKRHGFVKMLEPEIRQAVTLMETSFRNGGKLLICGNGGSNADADHIVGELMKPFRIRRPLEQEIKTALSNACGASPLTEKLEGGLPAINLGAHTSLVTALINDIGSEYIFAQQVIGYGRLGDVLLGISTSGNSSNILYAGEVAKAKGIQTIGLTGCAGEKMQNSFDLILRAGADAAEDIQDMHSTIYHIMCAALETQFWGS